MQILEKQDQQISIKKTKKIEVIEIDGHLFIKQINPGVIIMPYTLNDDGTPFFATEYLIRTELKMTEEEIESNQQWLDSKEDEADEAAAAAAGGAAPAGGGGGAPAATAAETPAEGGSETTEGGEVKGTGQL